MQAICKSIYVTFANQGEVRCFIFDLVSGNVKGIFISLFNIFIDAENYSVVSLGPYRVVVSFFFVSFVASFLKASYEL